MFTVGEFARLAQVSKRLLRYYDEIGLLKPNHIDPSSGYRVYSADQMLHLNRILALKELGLSLDQIRQTLDNNISTDEMQGMLLLKKAEIEQQLSAELQRIRKIESRLQAIRDDETNKPLNVVIKQIPSQAALSLRRVVETFEMGLEIFRQIQTSLPARNNYGMFFCICYNESVTESNLDLEIGVLADSKSSAPLVLQDGLELQFRELPAADTMATTVVTGPLETIHRGYTAIGRWVDIHGYRLNGTPRELCLQIAQTPSGNDLITEIQFPVEKIQ